MDSEISKPDPDPAPPGLELQHPLLVETVFRSIASNIPYLQLVELRMVCKIWDDLVTAILNSRKNFMIKGDFGTCCCNKIKFTTSQFKKDDIGIAEVKLEKIDFTEYLGVLRCLCHPQMIHLSRLHLHNCAISEETLKYILRLYCQTLEELIFTINTPSLLVHQEEMQEVFIEEILIHPLPIPLYPDPPRWGTSDIEADLGRTVPILKFPHIKKLHLTSHTVEYDVEEIAATFPAVVDLVLIGLPVPIFSINHISERPVFPKLRRLKMESVMAHWQTQFEDQISRLVDMGMNLRHLELTKVALTDYMIHQIHSLLLSQSDTLESFKLTLRSWWATTSEDERHCPNIPSNILPTLPKLSEIYLPEEVINNFTQALKRIPNIRSLSFICTSVSSWDTLGNIPSEMEPYLQVQQLTLAHVPPEDLRQMSRLFPNLTRLSIYYCTNELLQIVFANFKKLQALEVASSEDDMTDSGMLGISSEDLESGDQVDHPSNKTEKSSGSICDLKELQKLLLMPRNNMAITDKSFLSGVLELPALTHLELSNIKVSDRLEKQLAKCGFHYRAITTVLTANSEEVTFDIYKRDSGSPSSQSSAPKGISQFIVSV